MKIVLVTETSDVLIRHKVYCPCMRARLRALLRRPRAFCFMSLLNKLARLHCMFIDLIKRQRCMINAVRYSKLFGDRTKQRSLSTDLPGAVACARDSSLGGQRNGTRWQPCSRQATRPRPGLVFKKISTVPVTLNFWTHA